MDESWLLTRALSRSPEIAPSVTAIADLSTEISYRELWSRSNALADELRKRGVGRHEALAVLGRFDTTGVFLVLGAILSGSHICLIDASQPPSVQAAILEQFRPAFVAGQLSDLARVNARPGASEANGNLIPGIDLLLGSQAHTPAPTPAAVGTITFFTSGTTGRPKGVVHDQRSLLFGIWSTLAIQIEVLGTRVDVPRSATALDAAVSSLTESTRPLGLCLSSAMPFTTISGFSMLMRSLVVGGACFVINGPFDADKTLELIEHRGVTNLAVSPFMAQSLLRSQRRRPRDTSRLLSLGLGAGPADSSLVPYLEQTFGCLSLIGYGTTETAGVLTMSSPNDPVNTRACTIGRPVLGVDAWVSNEAGDPVSDGSPGQLIVSTEALMLGYVGDPRLYDAGQRPGRGIFATGDRAVIGSDGSIQLLGRLTELIVRGGQNIDPVAIEQHLEAHPSVRSACVLGIASRVAGEEDIVAMVEPEPGQQIDPVLVRRHCLSTLGAARTPSRIVVGELPRTSDGSVRRGEVRTSVHSSRHSHEPN